MDPKELKDNFVSQLEKAQDELNQVRRILTQREALVLKLQGAVEAMAIQLSEENETETGSDVSFAPVEVV